MSLPEIAIGKWDMESSEKFNEYLSELGVGLAKRTIAAKVKSSQEFTIGEDGTWNIKLNSSAHKFKIGEQFDDTTADGRKVKVTVTIDGNTLVTVQDGAKPCRITREFSQDSFIMKMTCNGVTCTRVYKRVHK